MGRLLSTLRVLLLQPHEIEETLGRPPEAMSKPVSRRNELEVCAALRSLLEGLREDGSCNVEHDDDHRLGQIDVLSSLQHVVVCNGLHQLVALEANAERLDEDSTILPSHGDRAGNVNEQTAATSVQVDKHST